MTLVERFRETELFGRPGFTNLGMLIDPDKQRIQDVRIKADGFIAHGGDVFLIGGSGRIDQVLFDGTVEAVVEAKRLAQVETPVYIFPGDVRQIPKTSEGITGVLNYSYILGGGGVSFDATFPPEARSYVNMTLQQREIRGISTLYILGGDEEATVSRVSGIVPLDLSEVKQQTAMLECAEGWLGKGIEAVFIDAGSNARQAINPDVLRLVKERIDRISPGTLFFVGGGVKTPEQARALRGTVDIISVGGHFEERGIDDLPEFLTALTQ